jgi:hypothetical protein
VYGGIRDYLDPMVKFSYISKTDGQMFYIFLDFLGFPSN